MEKTKKLNTKTKSLRFYYRYKINLFIIKFSTKSTMFIFKSLLYFTFYFY